MNIRVGIDGGGTSTRAVLVDENLAVLARGEAGSSNHYSVGLERAVQNIRSAVQAALNAASLPQNSIGAWGLGLAGACSLTEQTLLTNALQPLVGPVQLVVDADAAAAWAGAFGGAPGAICIAGTGANCFGVDQKGNRARADGWGPLLGDRGSGYWIGESALRAVCAALDGAAPQTSLCTPVLAHFGVADINALVAVIYQPNFERSRIAALLPLILEMAPTDAVAAQILESAGQELARTALCVLKQLNLTSVAITGGVLVNAPPVRVAFQKTLSQSIESAQIAEPLYDAAIGAALLAAK